MLQPPHLSFDAENLLHMMSNLVGQYVGLCEFAGSAEALAQFVEEAQIDVHLFISGAVERSCCRFGRSAPGLNRVAEEHQFCMPVGSARLRQQALPVPLHVIKDERHELHFPFLAGGTCGVGSGFDPAGRLRTAPGEHGEKVLFEDEAKYDEYESSAYSQGTAAESPEAGATPAAAALAPVFYVFADITWRPLH